MVPAAVDPGFVLRKDEGTRAVVGITSLLSMAGSLLIILSYLIFKDIRTKARLILLHLSLTDFGVGMANFVGDAVNFDKYYVSKVNGTLKTPSDMTQFFCKAQAFLAVFFTLSSILWTCVLAVYMYFLTLKKGVRHYVWVACVLCYCLPLMTSLWLLLTDRMGYSPYNSSGWCSLHLKEVTGLNNSMDGVKLESDIYAAVFGYDLWIITTIILVVVTYLSTHAFIREEVGLHYAWCVT